LQTVPQVPRTIPTAPSFEVKTRKGIDEHLARQIEELARRKAQTTGPTLVVDQKRGEAGLVSASPGLALAAVTDLEKVRTLIDKKKFREALGLLESVLRQLVGHAEALYLKAFCQHSLGEHEPALETLAIHAAGFSRDRESRVRLLRVQIREKMSPGVAVEALMLAATGRAGDAVRRLTRLVHLDPEAALYHILLVQSHMACGNLSGAAEAARRAEPVCQGREQEVLNSLRAEIDRLEVERALTPARDRYRELKFRKARSELDRVRPTHGDRPLWKTFHNYLEDLGGGVFSAGRSPLDVVPRGAPRDVETMHFFLVGHDLQLSRRMMADGDFANAETTLRTAYGYAPHFPYMNFLLGACLFKLLWSEMLSGTAPDLQTARRRLQLAHDLTAIAEQDPEITEAPELMVAIDASDRMFEEIEKDLEQQRREMAEMSPLCQEFGSVMESAKDGITSTEHFRKIQTRMRTIRDKTAALRPGIHSGSGLEQVKQFTEILDKNWKALERIEPEVVISEEIGAMHTELDRILGGIKGGVGSSSQLERLESDLGSLRQRINAFRARHKRLEGGAAEAMDKLDQAAKTYEGQLSALKSQMGESETVNRLIQRFNEVMISAQSAYTIHEVPGHLRDLKLGIDQARGRIVSEDGRRRLQELGTAIENVFGLFSRYK